MNNRKLAESRARLLTKMRGRWRWTNESTKQTRDFLVTDVVLYGVDWCVVLVECGVVDAVPLVSMIQSFLPTHARVVATSAESEGQ